jgi:ABC-type multidrug transport system permease subunit
MPSPANSPVVQLTLWRIREFTREFEALFWVFAFPIVLAFALGLAFKSRGPETIRVAVEDSPDAVGVMATLAAVDRIEPELMSVEDAQNELRRGRVALVVQPGTPITFRYDSTRSESELARLVVHDALQEAAGRRDVAEVRDRRVTEPGARYIDFLIPGLLGLNIMGTGMWGVGFGIVKTRTQKLLKRLLASPMRRRDYLLSYILARLVFLGLEVTAVLLFGHLVFDVPIRGSLPVLAVVVLLGAIAFAGLGLLVASRSRTIEGVSGLMNLVMVPMWIGSGVFFAYSNFPDVVQPVLRVLPLTALNDALRAVLLDGVPLTATLGFLGILVFWSVSSFGVALKIFRWD